MSLRLSNGDSFSLSGAIGNESNLLHRLRTSNEFTQFCNFLWSQRASIEAVCAHHLGIQQSQCTVQDRKTWMRGQFNVCVLLHISRKDGGVSRKIFRCPLAHKLGERYRPGASDEKVRVEVANYSFLEEKCPDIPISQLHGFGLSNGHHVGRSLCNITIFADRDRSSSTRSSYRYCRGGMRKHGEPLSPCSVVDCKPHIHASLRVVFRKYHTFCWTFWNKDTYFQGPGP